MTEHVKSQDRTRRWLVFRSARSSVACGCAALSFRQEQSPKRTISVREIDIPTILPMGTEIEAGRAAHPVGVGLRLLAALGDLVIAGAIALVAGKLYYAWVIAHSEPGSLDGLEGIWLPPIWLLSIWPYVALTECSPLRGTFGKRLVGLAVVDSAGGRITVLQASGRYWVKVAVMAGIWMAILMPLLLALVPILDGTRGVFVLFVVLPIVSVLGMMVLIGIDRSKRGPHDHAARTFVVRRRDLAPHSERTARDGESAPTHHESPNFILGRASIGARMGAAAADGVLAIGIAIASWPLLHILSSMLSDSFETPLDVVWIYGVVPALIGIYFAWFESSPQQASLGKSRVGLQVVRLSGSSIGFGRASLRFWTKYAVICGVLSLGAGATTLLRGTGHRLESGMFFLCWLLAVFLVIGIRGRGVQDVVVGTRVMSRQEVRTEDDDAPSLLGPAPPRPNMSSAPPPYEG